MAAEPREGDGQIVRGKNPFCNRETKAFARLPDGFARIRLSFFRGENLPCNEGDDWIVPVEIPTP